MSGLRYVRLRDLVEDVKSGVSPICEDRSPEEAEHGVLTLAAITGGELNPSAAKAISSRSVRQEWPTLRRGSLLVTRASGSLRLVGACALVPEDDALRIVPDTAWVVTLREDCGVPIRWVAEFLRSVEGRRAIEGIARGTSGIWKITKGGLAKLLIPVVSEARMNRTDSTGAGFERLVRLINARIRAGHERRTGLARQLLLGQRRFPGFRGEWQFRPLNELATNVIRRNLNDGVERVLTCSGRFGLIDQTEFFSKTVAGDSREEYFLLKRGEFAYNRSAMTGYPYGAIKRLNRYDEGVLSTLNICFALCGDAWLSEFATHVFESGILERQLRRITRVGSRAHGLLNVTKSDFFALEVPVPSVDEQRKIASVLSALDHEITLLEQQRDAFANQKRALMHCLLSGDIGDVDSAA